MHLFDINGQIRKFSSALAILHTYFPVRLSYYNQRRTALLANLTAQLTTLTHKSRFIQLITSNTITITNTKRADLLHAMSQHGLAGPAVEGLLDMRIASFSVEEVERLEGERLRCEAEVRRVEGLTAEQMWEADLDRLEARLTKLLAAEGEADRKQDESLSSSMKKTEVRQRSEKRAVPKGKGSRDSRGSENLVQSRPRKLVQ